jgi:predicted DCC family thiol-disulfide oxidoreductase YuxK
MSVGSPLNGRDSRGRAASSVDEQGHHTMIEPAQHPQVILFDGDCTLCSAWISFVIRQDVRSVFRLAPRQSDAARRLLAPFRIQPDRLDSIAVIDGAALHTHSDAVLHILSHLGFPWRICAALSIVPRPLRDSAYRLLARNRSRLSGQHGQCRTPAPEDADRFLR